MSRYTNYEDYINSEMDWVDALPAHWKRVGLRWASQLYAGGTPSKAVEAYWENGSVPWINSGEVNQGLISEVSTYITEEAYINSSAKWIPTGSLVMALAGQGKTKGMVAQLAIDATCNQSMAAIVPDDFFNARYLFWWLTFNYQNIRNMAGGDLRDGLNLELIGNIQCPLPSTFEMQKIANFLDHETAKIDTLIAKQQELIKLLKEKRLAVISHAVAKGLNPNAPMRDSGVEWLGEVPEHWGLLPLKRAIELQRGHDLPSDSRIEGEVPIVSSGGVIAYHNEVKAKGPGIVTGRYGTIGEFYLEVRDFWPLNTALYSVNTYQNNVKYLWYLLQSIKHLFILNSMKSAVPGVDRNDLHPEIISLPFDSHEQQQIVDYLDAKLKQIDKIENRALQGVELLQERRTALISAAVTGKIDVRNWQTPSETALAA